MTPYDVILGGIARLEVLDATPYEQGDRVTPAWRSSKHVMSLANESSLAHLRFNVFLEALDPAGGFDRLHEGGVAVRARLTTQWAYRLRAQSQTEDEARAWIAAHAVLRKWLADWEIPPSGVDPLKVQTQLDNGGRPSLAPDAGWLVMTQSVLVTFDLPV